MTGKGESLARRIDASIERRQIWILYVWAIAIFSAGQDYLLSLPGRATPTCELERGSGMTHHSVNIGRAEMVR